MCFYVISTQIWVVIYRLMLMASDNLCSKAAVTPFGPIGKYRYYAMPHPVTNPPVSSRRKKDEGYYSSKITKNDSITIFAAETMTKSTCKLVSKKQQKGSKKGRWGGAKWALQRHPRLCSWLLYIIYLYSLIYRHTKFTQKHPVLPFQLPFLHKKKSALLMQI